MEDEVNSDLELEVKVVTNVTNKIKNEKIKKVRFNM